MIQVSVKFNTKNQTFIPKKISKQHNNFSALLPSLKLMTSPHGAHQRNEQS